MGWTRTTDVLDPEKMQLVDLWRRTYFEALQAGRTPEEAAMLADFEVRMTQNEMAMGLRTSAAPDWTPDNPPGMPRPLWDNKPVPWSSEKYNDRDEPHFEAIDGNRQHRAIVSKLCVLCGMPLDDPAYGFIQGGHLVDGALHQRCAAMTRAHCPHIRDRYAQGVLTLVQGTPQDFSDLWIDGMDGTPDLSSFPSIQPVSSWQRTAKIPANYTEEDPYDISGKQPLYEALQANWWELPEEEQRRAIVNAFRSTIISPQTELKWNAVAYQHLMNIPAEETDPEVFESTLREFKRKWDNPGQVSLEGEVGLLPEETIPGRLNPPFWGNVRALANLGYHAEELRQAALEDLEHGGTGQHFRQRVLDMNIPGVGPKVTSFAWLILMPTKSELATIDLWMMKHLDKPADKAPKAEEYLELEEVLKRERDETYGPGTPLGQYQWGVWDKLRTPGYHQDHSPFRVLDPTSYRDVVWEGPNAWERAQQNRPNRRGPEVSPLQMNFLGKWRYTGPTWTKI